MDSATLLINSANRTTGSPNSFNIIINWPYIYSASGVKILQVYIPYDPTFLGKIIYVISNIIGGNDNGYIIEDKNINNIIAVIAVSTTNSIIEYRGKTIDPIFTTNGTYFGIKYQVPVFTRSLDFSLIFSDGTPVPLTNDWSIIFTCYFTVGTS